MGGFGHADHDSLHIAVPLGAQRIHNGLPRNRSHQIAAANHGKIFLQGVNRLLQCVLQGVGSGERGELRQHDFIQANALQHGFEKYSAFLELRSDEDEKAQHGKPGAARAGCLCGIKNHAEDHENKRQAVGHADGAARGSGQIGAAGEDGAQQAARVERIGRNQIHCSE